ncbi:MULTISPECIES: hypothetical protein [Streptomyces]|uniref:hypothetical protein n=1 Tax=Streptomyces TaxID=1883 RepID=UPI001181706B|nr:hypothetical protein [Streptomyces kasugaensis]
MPNLSDLANPLDLLKQVAYVEHVATEETRRRPGGPSLGCFELLDQMRPDALVTWGERKRLVFEN